VALYYKCYRPQEGVRILRQLRLYFTPPRFFNDINEMTPFVSWKVSDADYARYFYPDPRVMGREYRLQKASRAFAGSYEDFLAQARTDGAIIDSVRRHIRNSCSGLQRWFKTVMSKHVGVACFATNATSNLMWSHYADSHTGLCIGVSFDASDLRMIDSRAVQYTNTKVTLPAHFVELSREDRNAGYGQVAFTKGNEWRYEHEYGLLADLRKCKRERHDCDLYFYQSLDKRDIKQVLVGARCEIVNEVRATVQELGIEAAVLTCSQQRKSFALKVTGTT
jgi:hypothetical protein